jgi:hypothetical protein
MKTEKHPIADLPFVADRKKPFAPGQWPRCFWSVTPTGNYEADCRTGDEYALAYMRYRNATSEIGSLATIVKDMPRDLTGIEVGFLQLMDYAAMYGVGAAEARVAYCDQWRAEEATKKRKRRLKRGLARGGREEAQP